MTQCKCGLCETVPHDSDCAVHNEPEARNGDCDCKSEPRHQVSVRAKSVLKLDTGQSNLDYTYDKDSTIDGMAKNVMHAVVFNKGVTEARAFFKEFLSSYEFGWRDPDQPTS